MLTDYATIANENIKRYGTAIDEYGPTLLSDRYSDRTHFVYELLQNAEDAIGWRKETGLNFDRSVKIELLPDTVRFIHSGLGFDEKHVRAICSIGRSAKAGSLTAIGKHGIGFKSVYAYSHHPEIHSGDEHFMIELFVRPMAVSPKVIDQDATLFELPLDHPDVPPATSHGEIAARLEELGVKTLLFLKHIESIEWKVDNGKSGQYLKETRVGANSIESVVLLGEQEEGHVQEHWLIFRQPVFNNFEHAGFVEIAFELKEVEDGKTTKQEIVPVTESPLVVFFPTEKETHFGFLIQGPYRTTPSRDNVPKDDAWNQYLVKCTAELVVEAAKKLREHRLLSISALEALAVDSSKYDFGGPASMFKPIADALIHALREEALVPAHPSGYVAGKNAVLARAENVRSMLNSGELTELLGASTKKRWVLGNVTRDRKRNLRDFLLTKLNVTELDAEGFVRKVSDKFIASRSDRWIERYYEFLFEQSAVRRKLALSDRKIIRLSNDKHVQVKDSNGVRLAYLPSSEKTGFPTVKSSVCRSENARRFLTDLGLTVPDPVDDVIHNILPRYKRRSESFPAEFDRDIRRIVEAYQTDSNSRKQELVNSLKRAKWIPCYNAASKKVYLTDSDSNTYLPTERLLQLFKGNCDIWFVDRSRQSMLGKKCQAVLEACGIGEYLIRKPFDCDLSSEELTSLREDHGLAKASGQSVTDHQIEGLETTLKQIAERELGWEERSLSLWGAIHDAIRRYREGFLFGGYSWKYSRVQRTATIPAKFTRVLRDATWLPGPAGDPVRPSQICFADLPEEFRDNANTTLIELLNFKPDELKLLAEKSGIDPAILDVIRERNISSEDLLRALGIDPAYNKKPSRADTEPANQESGSESSDSDNLKKSSSSDSKSNPVSDLSKNQTAEAADVDSPGVTGTGAGSRSENDGPRTRETGSGSGTGERKSHPSSGESGENEARGSHTARDREGIIKSLQRQLKEATSTGVAPESRNDYDDLKKKRDFQTDNRFRDVVIMYERQHGRIPQAKTDCEAGHDIDSFQRVQGLRRHLIRRIEVKGKGSLWNGDEIVELSDRQFFDAVKNKVEEDVMLSEDFDYWLYVVEESGDGKFNVLPIRNPAKRSAHYEFRGGTWRHCVEDEQVIELSTQESSKV
jgi:hypothetical protein